MDIKKYQEETSRTYKKHTPLSYNDAVLLDWALGLPGEVGEVSELVKHFVFHGETLDRVEMAKELGDIMWYVSALCNFLKLDMSVVLDFNIAKLKHRYPVGFDKDSSAARHSNEVKFADTEEYAVLVKKLLRR